MELKHTVRKRFDKLPLLSLATLLLCAHPHPLLAQSDSADAAAGGTSHAVGLVIAQTAGHDIAGLVLRQADRKEFKHGIALFPGHPGIMRLREENGVIQYDLKGNFLLRSSVRWLDEQTLVVAVDAPSDEWANFSQYFRTTPRYGKDVAALLTEVNKQFTIGEWTFVGTSEGSVSAYHAALMNPELAKRLILTASVFSAGRNGPGLSNVKPAEIKMPLLVVHHADDPCQSTRYRDAVDFARNRNSPLMTIKGGGPGRGNPCMAFTAHGFVGMETETVHAMRSWVQSGVAVPEVIKAQ